MSGPATSGAQRLPAVVRRHFPGLVVVALGVAAAYGVSRLIGFLGALTAAIILGVVARNGRLLRPAMESGLAFAAKKMLRAGVVLLGLQLAVPDLLELRPVHLAVIAVTAVVTFIGTHRLGRLQGLSRECSLLFAAGFSICGASAVAAMNSVVDGDDDDVAAAIAQVTLYGSVVIFLYPLLQGGLGLDDQEFGIWVGASVHEVAQVVAVAAVVGEAALVVAVLAKLGRVVLLAPIVAAVAMSRRRREPPYGRAPIVPLFVVGFLAMTVVRSVDIVPELILDGAATLTTLLLAGAMFGLGTGVCVRTMVRTGGRAMIVGAGATVLAAGTAYAGLIVARS